MRRAHRKSRNVEYPALPKAACVARRSRFTLAALGAGVGVLVLGGTLIVRTTAAPQSETITTAEQATPTIPDAPGTIDGAKNPELIPDEVALRMIVLAVAEPPDATEEQKARARAKLRPIGLSEEDTEALLSLLTDFRGQADALERQVAAVRARTPFPHPDSTDYEQLVELGRQKSQLATDVVAALPARLSSEGLVNLLMYLPEAKKGMKTIKHSMVSKEP